jgi:hypothetical protein
MNIAALLPDQLVPIYLMSCYLYYVMDTAVLTDGEFDALYRRLDAEWDFIRHPHKELIERSSLKSGYYLSYPLRVRSAAIRWKESA